MQGTYDHVQKKLRNLVDQISKARGSGSKHELVAHGARRISRIGDIVHVGLLGDRRRNHAPCIGEPASVGSAPQGALVT